MNCTWAKSLRKSQIGFRFSTKYSSKQCIFGTDSVHFFRRGVHLKLKCRLSFCTYRNTHELTWGLTFGFWALIDESIGLYKDGVFIKILAKQKLDQKLRTPIVWIGNDYKSVLHWKEELPSIESVHEYNMHLNVKNVNNL